MLLYGSVISSLFFVSSHTACSPGDSSGDTFQRIDTGTAPTDSWTTEDQETGEPDEDVFVETLSPDSVHILTTNQVSSPQDGHAITEFSADLSESWSLDLSEAGAMGAWRFDNGDTVYVKSYLPPDFRSMVEYLDSTGELLWSYGSLFLFGLGFSHGVVATPAGDFITVDSTAGLLLSFDADGQVLWSMPSGEGDELGTPNGLSLHEGSDGQVLLAVSMLLRSGVDGSDQLVLYRLGSQRTDPPEELWRVALVSDQEDGRTWPHGPHFQDDGSLLICLSALGSVMAVDLTDGTELWSIPGDSGGTQLAFPRDATFLPDGTLLVADAGTELLRIWDPFDTFQVVSAIEVPSIFSATTVICSQDGSFPCL